MQREVAAACLLIAGLHGSSDRVGIAPARQPSTGVFAEGHPTLAGGSLTGAERAPLALQMQTAAVCAQQTPVAKRREGPANDARVDRGELPIPGGGNGWKLARSRAEVTTKTPSTKRAWKRGVQSEGRLDAVHRDHRRRRRGDGSQSAPDGVAWRSNPGCHESPVPRLNRPDPHTLTRVIDRLQT
ncbi:MAG: hypothetical protein IPM29_03105 [Planctomycetes bacterium]|nr:hypothetical protein [Planctomycetota bacterium]